MQRSKGDEGKAEAECTDMFTREGNIPHINRNEKPTAATKHNPLPLLSKRDAYARDETERSGRKDEGGSLESEGERVRGRQETVLNHFPFHLTLLRHRVELRE